MRTQKSGAQGGQPVTVSALPWLGLIGAVLLLLISASYGLLFRPGTEQALTRLSTVTYHEDGFRQLKLALNPQSLAVFRLALLACGVVGLVGTVLFKRSSIVSAARAEASLAWSGLFVWWRRLPSTSRLLVLGLLLLLLGIRCWYMTQYPLSTDEVASYDYFVSRGPLTICSFYPIPNNHVGYNLLAWPLASLSLPPLLVMRLPTVLLGTMGTALSLLLLTRIVGLRLAWLVTGLVHMAPIWAYYSVAGRGYFLQIVVLQVGFYSAIELLKTQTHYRHLAWSGLLITGVCGLYLIPTYAYPLAGLFTGLGASFLARRQWRHFLELLCAGLSTLVLTVLLYVPIGIVSGWDRLLSNRYVVSHAPGQFWGMYRAVLYETAADLFGPSLRLSGPLWLGTALIGGVAAWHWVPKGSRRTTALLSWVILTFPLLLMAAQRVFAPTRVLLHLTYFAYLWAVLMITPLLRLRHLRFASEWVKWPSVVAVVVGVGGWRLWQDQGQVRAAQQEAQLIAQARQWLVAKHVTSRPAQIWLNAPLHELFFAHYESLANSTRLQLRSGRESFPPAGYDFWVLDRKAPSGLKATLDKAPFRTVYHDAAATIYTR